MHLRNFDLIAFDWDGTLYDSTSSIVRSIQAAVCDVGGSRPTDQAAAYVIGMSLVPALAHAAPDVPEHKHPELAARYRHHYAVYEEEVSLFNGVLPLLAMLKSRGHKLAVATGKSRRGLDELLSAPSLQGVFDDSRTADETAGKPHPRMLHELMEAFDVPAERVLMVGDTTHDLQMAVQAGCPSVAVSYGAHTPDDFPVYQPLHIAHSVSELHDWLVQHA